MNQNIKDCLFIHSFERSIEELELFHSYRAQLDSSFNIYKQNNLVITNQENKLSSIKIETELMSYEIKKRSLRQPLKVSKKKLNFKKLL